MATVIITVDGKPFNVGDGTKAKIVADITERNAIAETDRFVGLIVLALDATADAGVDTGGATYVLKSGLTNTDWEKISNSVPTTGGEGVIMSITPSGNLLANRFIVPGNTYANANKAYAVTTANVTGGNPTDVIVTGIAYVEVGGDIYLGESVIAGTDGKAMSLGGGSPVNGIALEDGVNGDIIKVKLI